MLTDLLGRGMLTKQHYPMGLSTNHTVCDRPATQVSDKRLANTAEGQIRDIIRAQIVHHRGCVVPRDLNHERLRKR
jgi:hypothetical protein